ncbi:MAG: hypothetical protein ABJN42_24865 [Roseibium sp.]|uniref:hypothetical protein n=1 Tax=Roseibium sp. TaxID=1936156 RepID=UPI003298F329
MPSFFHVTSRENAQAILEDGFSGGWGDNGFGVYLYDNPSDAEGYADDNGWDGELDDPVILKVTCEYEDLHDIEVQPDWPNPEDYDAVSWYPMDPDKPEELWKPEMLLYSAREPEPDTGP